jgi:hypothetical protein
MGRRYPKVLPWPGGAMTRQLRLERRGGQHADCTAVGWVSLLIVR